MDGVLPAWAKAAAAEEEGSGSLFERAQVEKQVCGGGGGTPGTLKEGGRSRPEAEEGKRACIRMRKGCASLGEWHMILGQQMVEQVGIAEQLGMAEQIGLPLCAGPNGANKAGYFLDAIDGRTCQVLPLKGIASCSVERPRSNGRVSAKTVDRILVAQGTSTSIPSVFGASQHCVACAMKGLAAKHVADQLSVNICASGSKCICSPAGANTPGATWATPCIDMSVSILVWNNASHAIHPAAPCVICATPYVDRPVCLYVGLEQCISCNPPSCPVCNMCNILAAAWEEGQDRKGKERKGKKGKGYVVVPAYEGCLAEGRKHAFGNCVGGLVGVWLCCLVLQIQGVTEGEAARQLEACIGRKEMFAPTHADVWPSRS
eukprot:scaffold16685_cov21-Tisochrysis_lutea.AAC.1